MPKLLVSWELEYGFVVKKLRSEDSKVIRFEFPGEVDWDYGLPWNVVDL